MTWAETEQRLEELKKLFFDFHEAHSAKEVEKDPALQKQIKSLRDECIIIHDIRISHVIARRVKR